VCRFSFRSQRIIPAGRFFHLDSRNCLLSHSFGGGFDPWTIPEGRARLALQDFPAGFRQIVGFQAAFELLAPDLDQGVA
jgi:hypothetical protein